MVLEQPLHAILSGRMSLVTMFTVLQAGQPIVGNDVSTCGAILKF